MAASLPEHLDSSELGTKQYWEDTYIRELANHKTAPEDEGTIWFSDAGAEEKMIDFLDCYADDGILFKTSLNEARVEPSSFLDLGTGNGHMLFSLRDAGWDGVMVGVDYSGSSVELAKRIGETRALKLPDDANNESSDDEDDEDDEGRSTQPVHFHEYDILHPRPIPGAPKNGFDVILDKGTFDAISLSTETSTDGRRIVEEYLTNMLKLLRSEGYFLVTSCNWTEDELKSWFEKQGEFEICDRVAYPSFTFGGKKGSSVVTVCFKKS